VAMVQMEIMEKKIAMAEDGVITISELEGRMRTEDSSYFY